MTQQRDINKIQTLIFMQRLYVYLLILRYLQFLQTIKSTYPDGAVVNYTYDNANRLTSIINGGGRTYSYQYDNLGRRTKLGYPNGATANYSYDTSGSLTSLIHKTSSGAIIDSFTYTLDKVGNRLTKTEPSLQHTYQYDTIYRLIKAPTTNEQYTYDPVGNRLTGPKTGNLYTYNQGNELTGSNSSQYTYDRNGNLINKVSVNRWGKTETWTYTYDYENRLVKAENTGGLITVTVTFKYDPFGRRIEKKAERKAFGVNEIDTHTYLYDNEDIIIEYLTLTVNGIATDMTTRYVHGPGIDEPLAMERWGKVFYYHADGLGSTTALTDAAGKVVKRYSYDSFGNMKITLDPFMNPYTYTGREWDWETGLYYYRARYYDAKVGRFVSEDPIGFGGGINLYLYANQNPINAVDPFGLFCIPLPASTGTWEDYRDQGIIYKVTAVFADIGGHIGTCYWQKCSATEQIREVTQRWWCCERQETGCGNSEWKCFVKSGNKAFEYRTVERIIATAETGAIRWNTGYGENFCCNNPWTKTSYCGRAD
jgi:RHS repeat-associated protein